MTLAGICHETLLQWRRAGLFPATTKVHYSRCMYARIDLLRVMSAPRRGRSGVSRPAVLAAIHSARANGGVSG